LSDYGPSEIGVKGMISINHKELKDLKNILENLMFDAN
jgi:hypothetical protein